MVIIHTLTSRNDHNHVLLIVMQELGCFRLVKMKSLMKLHEMDKWGNHV